MSIMKEKASLLVDVRRLKTPLLCAFTVRLRLCAFTVLCCVTAVQIIKFNFAHYSPSIAMELKVSKEITSK